VLVGVALVLTFLSGFVSVRLHDAYRDAVARQLKIGLALVGRTGPFPVRELEEDYEEIRRSFSDAMATPVLVVLVVFTGLGIWLDVLTANAAHVGWLDRQNPEQFGALVLLGLPLVAVTLLVGADYLRLRRRLGKALDTSPVGQLLLAESAVAKAWAAKRAWVTADVAWEYTYLAEEALAADETPTWRKDTRKNSRARAHAAAKIRAATPALQQAQQRLAGLAATEGVGQWGYIAGLRAIADLVHAFDPELDSYTLWRERATQIQSWLQTAMTAEPEEPRWVAAAALFAEALDDAGGAARCIVRERDLGEASSARVPSLLRPGEGSTRQARLLARRPSTYDAAFTMRKDAGDWNGAALFAYEYLRATLAQSRLEMEATPPAPAVACMREAIAGLVAADDLAWLPAADWLRRCRKALAEPQAVVALRVMDMNLTPQVDAIEQDLIAPRRTAPGPPPDARHAQVVERSAARFALVRGIRIKDGVVTVRGHSGSCPVQDARAKVTVRRSGGVGAPRRSPPSSHRRARGGRGAGHHSGPQVQGRRDGRCDRWRGSRAPMGRAVQCLGRQQSDPRRARRHGSPAAAEHGCGFADDTELRAADPIADQPDRVCSSLAWWDSGGPASYSPTLLAAFSSNAVAYRIYRRSVVSDRCRVCAAMERSEAPAAAAEVANPARSEWLESPWPSISVRATARRSARVTPRVDSRAEERVPQRSIPRHTGPVVSPAIASQRRTAVTGSVAWCCPAGTATTSPACSWSVFDPRRLMSRPRSVKSRSSTSRETRSEARPAKAKPSRSRA
jgi:hypothetical protein